MILTEHFEDYMDLLQSILSLNTLSMLLTAFRFLGDISPDDYDPRNIFQLVAKVVSSQNTSLRQGLFNQKTQDFGNIPESCIIYCQEIMMTYIPFRSWITLYMVLFSYLNSTFTEEFVTYQRKLFPTCRAWGNEASQRVFYSTIISGGKICCVGIWTDNLDSTLFS